jgi:CheY-like chemotaxis protein
MSTPVAPLVVLVVEDEQLLREMVEPALADAGYSVLLAHNGSEALKYLDLAQAVGRLPSERANSTQRFLWST